LVRDLQGFSAVTTDAEIDQLRRDLRTIRYDPKYNAGASDAHRKNCDARVSMRRLAGLVRASYSDLYCLMNGDVWFRPSEQMMRRWRFAIDLVMVHGLRWKREGEEWRAVMPDGMPPQIPPEMTHTRQSRWNGRPPLL
jgi:hypothetical protein